MKDSDWGESVTDFDTHRRDMLDGCSRSLQRLKELYGGDPMTKDRRQSLLDMPNSYNSSKKAPIDFYLAKTISLLNKKGYKTDFCCSGHTTQKHCEIWDSKVSDFVEGTEAYILFKELYNIPRQEVLHGCSRISATSCGTLMGIKKACRKLYRIAQKLPKVNSLGIEKVASLIK